MNSVLALQLANNTGSKGLSCYLSCQQDLLRSLAKFKGLFQFCVFYNTFIILSKLVNFTIKLSSCY